MTSNDLLTPMFTAQDRRPPHVHPLDPATISPFQRGLLVLVGLVTQYIEAYQLEPIVVHTLSQATLRPADGNTWLDVPTEVEVWSRQVLLEGESSSTPYVYGEAFIVPDRVSRQVRDDLRESDLGLGRILRSRQIEMHGELLWFGTETVAQLPEALSRLNDCPMISRTYRFISAGKPAILITERFPMEET